MKKVLGIVFGANIVAASPTDNAINAIDDGINAVDNLVDIEKEEIIVDAQNYIENNRGSQISTDLQHNSALEQSSFSAKIGLEIENSLEDLLQKAYENDEIVNNIIAAKE